MSESNDNTLRVSQHPVRCSACGYYVAPDVIHCPQCGELIEPDIEPAKTTALVRRPSTTGEPHTRKNLPSTAKVVLQFLPSAHCVSLDLAHPVVLGRGALPGSDGLIDLSNYDARQHGVSRRHCLLKRCDGHLVAIDLGSSNGSYLNSDRLEAQQEYIVSSGDRLILGTLHILVTFYDREARS